MKPPVGSFPDPSSGREVVTKDYADANYSGAGAIAAARGDYIEARLSGNQAISANDTQIQFNTTTRSRGGLSVDGSGTFSSLKAGRTYFLMADIQTSGTTNRFPYSWYDRTGAVLIGKSGVAVSTSFTSTAGYSQVATAIFTPLVDTEVEVRTRDHPAAFTIESTNAWSEALSSAMIVEIGAVQAEVVGGLEYVDTITLASSQASVTFGTGGDGDLGRALDGDVDETYVIEYHCTNPGGTNTLYFNPNGVTTNQSSAQHFGGTSAGNSDDTRMRFGDQASGREFHGRLEFHAKSGKVRSMVSTGVHADVPDSPTGVWSVDYAAIWDDTTTNVTSLVLEGDQDLAAGSQFILWRRTRNNMKTTNASIYERTVQATVAQGTAAAVTYTTGRATFGGSAVGVNVELVDDTVVSGTVTVDFKVDGSTVLTATLDSTNTAFHRAATVVGAHPIAYGDKLEVDVTTSSLVTTGAGTPGIVVNITCTNDAYIKAPTGPDYLIAGLSANQTTNIALGNHIEFDLSSSRGDSITMSTGAGQARGLFTLQPGKTYEIHLSITAEINEGNTYARLMLDPADTALVEDSGSGSKVIRLTDVGGTGDESVGDSDLAVFTPTVATTIKVERVSGADDGPLVHWQPGTKLYIKELK